MALHPYCSMQREPTRSAWLHVIELNKPAMTKKSLLGTGQFCLIKIQERGPESSKWQNNGSNNQPVPISIVLNGHCNVALDFSTAPSIAAAVAQRWSCGSHSIWKRCAVFFYVTTDAHMITARARSIWKMVCITAHMFPQNAEGTRAVATWDKKLHQSLPVTILSARVQNNPSTRKRSARSDVCLFKRWVLTSEDLSHRLHQHWSRV